MVDNNSEDECLRLIKLKDYYEILGIPKTASEEEIRKAYKKLATRFHPDKNKAKNAEEAFKKINQAFSVLGTKEKKQRYDMYGTDEDIGMSTGHENFDPFEIFNMYFNEFNQGGPGMRRGQGGKQSQFSTFQNGNVSYTVYSSGGGFGGGFPGFGSFGFRHDKGNEGEEGDDDDNDIFSQLFNRQRGRGQRNINSNTNNNTGNIKKRQKEMQEQMQRVTMCIQFLPLLCCLVFFIFPLLLQIIF